MALMVALTRSISFMGECLNNAVHKNSIIEASKTRKPASFGYIAEILFARCRINEVDSIWWL
ncbi:hypothetical protein JI62_15050 [Halomonas campaniensis]|uniref:Uncharacterized protein n=1 Tax=Halomonas campaniensis TaxID=213554 RepID=A0A246RXQ8_9GAMM|nr:hypothetical protein JI62_15050 [Halomonas campaniensis]